MGYTHYWTVERALTTHERDELKLYAEILISKYQQILAGWDGTGKPEITDEAIKLNGAGEDSYETFTLSFAPDGAKEFCKTAQRPYDVVVVALLCLAVHIAPTAYSVSSDGDESDWQEGLEVARKIHPAGYTLRLPGGLR